MTTTDFHDIVDRWTAAERDGDRDGLDALLTDDFVGIGPVGFMLPKPAWLARFGPDLRYEHLELDEITARDYGDATVVVARQHATGEARGNPVPGDTRVSFVVVPAEGGQRRIAGIQYSFMAPVGG
ncbi:MAG: nuclear transport factor 2 family protein [Ilumatobacteraceae bacterium]